LFQDIERLKEYLHRLKDTGHICRQGASRDYEAKKLIQRIFQAKQTLNGDIKLVYLEDYNMTIGAMITAGVDVWLNTPEPPMEASGTSGYESCSEWCSQSERTGRMVDRRNIEGVTGWSIGEAVIGTGKTVIIPLMQPLCTINWNR
jgi:starch phosphorylase